MIRKLFTVSVSALVAGVLSSCGSLPFKRQPKVQPVQETPKEKTSAVQKPEPKKPAKPLPEAKAFYETAAASSSFFVSRPETDRTDGLPDKILRRGTVVQLLVPKAGSGWSKVKLVDAQTGYVRLTDLDIVSSSVRPAGFPTRGRGGIDTDGNLELPEPPTASSSGASAGGDTISLDSFDLESPGASSSSLPAVPGSTPSSDSLDNISMDSLPGL
ncbi:MAG: hypothetical protein ACI9R3_002764 [Verrucomicrobiales bacterium]|jgi:hypothetical protein